MGGAETADTVAQAPDQVADRSGPRRFRAIDVGSTLGRYQVVEELGAGGMATVYRARDRELRRDVAIKVLFPHLTRRRDIVARFQREARAAAALDHPNIVRVHDVGGGEVDARADARADTGADIGADIGADTGAGDARQLDPPYIVMELVRGKSLQELIEAHGQPPLAEVVASMGVVLCAALAEAHGAGIVHRDVKPANVMVTDGGRLALADFGVARIEDEDSSLVTRTGALLGTPAFMSPEQAMGDELDARSDIFSLGATLYRVATGVAPFAGPTTRVVTSIVTGDLVPPLRRNPAMGKELARVIERMMAHRREDRYASAAEAADALGRVASRMGPGQPAAELAAFFADPAAYTARRTPEVARATLELARKAARERALPQAMALADRVLALVPDSAEASEALAVVERLGQGRRRARWLLVAGAVLGVLAAVAAGARWTGSRVVAAVPDAGLDAGLDAGDAGDAAGDAALHPALHLIGGATVDERMGAGPGDGPDTAPGPVYRRAGQGDRHTGDREPGRKISRPDRRQETGYKTDDRKTDDRKTDDRKTDDRKTDDRRTDERNVGGDGDSGQQTGSVTGRPDAGAGAGIIEARPASVTLDIRPWCDVRIDGTDHGRASRDRVITLAPGAHEVVCTQGPGRAEWRRTITLKPGQRLDLSGSVLRPVRITIAVDRGDRVVIQGTSHANGVSLVLPPSRYRMDVMAGDRRVAGAWVSVPVVASCTVRDRPALDCYP